MAKWYFSVDGRAEGPVEDDVIIGNLQGGKLTLVDLVFKEGDDRWRTIGEVQQFKDVYAKVSLPPNPTMERVEEAPDEVTNPSIDGEVGAPTVSGGPFKFGPAPVLTWVLLQKVRQNSEERFVQNGPYSGQDLERMLASGKAKYSDYVWRPGYHRWARLGNLPEFDRRRKSRDGDTTPEVVPVPAIEMDDLNASSEDLFANVVRASVTGSVAGSVAESISQGASRPADPPPETDGRDLTEDTANAIDLGAFDEEPKVKPKPIDRIAPSLLPPPIEPAPPTREDADEDLKTVVYGADQKTVVYGMDGKTVVYGADGKTAVLPPPASPPPVQARPTFNLAASESRSVNAGMGGPSRVTPPSVSQPYDENVDEAEGMSESTPVPFPEDVALDEPVVPAGARWRRRLKWVAAGAAVVVVVGAIFVAGMIFWSDENGSGGENPVAAAPDGGSGSIQEIPPVPVPDAATNPGENSAAVPNPPPPAPVVVDAPPPPPQPVAKNVPPVVEPKPVPVAPTAAPDPVAAAGIQSIPPGTGKTTVLEVVPLRTEGTRPLLAIQTNAPVGEMIGISVRGRSGEILRLPSFMARLSKRRSGGEVPVIDLSNLRLPQGNYRVEVTAGQMSRVQTMFIGKKDAAFAQDLENHLKEISYQQQVEKRALFYSARKMEGLAKSLGDQYTKLRADARSWRGFYVGWQKDFQKARAMLVDRVNPEKRNQLAFPDEVLALKVAVGKLIEQATALNDSIISNTQARDVAGGGNLVIVKEFTRLKAQAAAISSRKN